MRYLNKDTEKYKTFCKFIMNNIKGAKEVVHLAIVNSKDGYLFRVYKKKGDSTVVKITHKDYYNHIGNWSDDIMISDLEETLEYGWHGFNVVSKPIGEMLLTTI